MTTTKFLDQLRALVGRGEVLVSLHGSEELAADGIRVHDVVDGLLAAELVEEYPDVLVTAYRPDPKKWDETWLKRRT